MGSKAQYSFLLGWLLWVAISPGTAAAHAAGAGTEIQSGALLASADRKPSVNTAAPSRNNARNSPPDSTGVSLTVEVFDRPVGNRVAARVRITDITDPNIIFEGISKVGAPTQNTPGTRRANSPERRAPARDGGSADSADGNTRSRRIADARGEQELPLVFLLPEQRTYRIEVEYDNRQYSQFYTASISEKDRLPIFLSGVPPVPAPRRPFYTPSPITRPLKTKLEDRLRNEMTAFFEASEAAQAEWVFPAKLEKLLARQEAAVRRTAWEAYRNAAIHDTLRQDFDNKQVRFESHVSPYTVKTVGTRPPNGWGLFIAMHGGGGTTQEFNDRQWRHMQIYYRDHPEAGGYIYVALRAPNNTWNGFYTDYAYPLIQNLLRQFMLFADVDPNKKFLMGYSHGGYGAFAIGPKMPDYFAAIHSSAAAPADGASPVTLRNTVFTTMIGSNDTMYGRYDRIREFKQQIDELRGSRTDIYPVTVQIVADHPHSGLPDRDKIAEMYPNVRNPVPRELSWRMTDRVIHDFFWLHTPTPQPGKELNVTIRDNRVIVSSDPTAADLTATDGAATDGAAANGAAADGAATGLTAADRVRTDPAPAAVLLDSRLIDFSRPVTLEYGGASSNHRLRPGLRTLCQTLQRRGDPELAFTAKLPLAPKPAQTR